MFGALFFLFDSFLKGCVVLKYAIVSEAKIKGHCCVVFGLFLDFRKVFSQIREKLFQFPVQIACNDNLNIVFSNDINNILLLIYLG